MVILRVVLPFRNPAKGILLDLIGKMKTVTEHSIILVDAFVTVPK